MNDASKAAALHVTAIGDRMLAMAHERGIRLPARLREHLGSNVDSRRPGWYWLEEADLYLIAKGCESFLVYAGKGGP